MDRKWSPQDESREGYITTWRSDISCPPVPETNFASFLLREMAQHGSKKALIDAATGEHYTYSDICGMVPRACANLAAAGVCAGDAVLLLSPNHIDFPIAQLAIQLLPAICVEASPSFSPEELAHVLRLSKARWAVVDENVLEKVKKVTTTLLPNYLKEVWVIGCSSSSHTSFSELIKNEKKVALPLNGKDTSFNPARTMALMMFSSGTTGLPKGVMISHRNVLTILMQHKCIVANERKDENATEITASRVLLCIPLSHNYATILYIQTVNVGGCAVLMREFTPDSFMDALQKYKITLAPIIPHIANYLIHSPLLSKYDISSLKGLMSASGPIATSTIETLTARVGCPMRQGYGLTETCAGVAFNAPPCDYKMGSVGRVMPYQEVKIVALGSSEGLPPGQEGEVWVRSPGIMMGYAPVPGAPPSPPATTPDGWLPTGDLGYCDHEGFLFITDRLKDVVKVKGYQVSPREVEDVLREVEGVGDVAVVGVPSSRLGEALRAFVVPRPGVVSISAQVLKDYVAARLVPHKQLTGGVQMVDALPKNAIGKVLKRRLLKDYLQAQATTMAVAPSSKL